MPSNVGDNLLTEHLHGLIAIIAPLNKISVGVTVYTAHPPAPIGQELLIEEKWADVHYRLWSLILPAYQKC